MVDRPSALRLAPDLPSATMNIVIDRQQFQLRLAPDLPSATILGCRASLETGLAYSWILVKKLHLSASK